VYENPQPKSESWGGFEGVVCAVAAGSVGVSSAGDIGSSADAEFILRALDTGAKKMIATNADIKILDKNLLTLFILTKSASRT
jgi:hypothetical protein